MQRAIRIRPEIPPEEPSGPSIAKVVTEPPPEDTGPDLDDYGLDEVTQGEEVAFG